MFLDNQRHRGSENSTFYSKNMPYIRFHVLLKLKDLLKKELKEAGSIGGYSSIGSDISEAIIDGLAPVYFVDITTSGGWRFFGSSLVLISKKV